MYIYILIITILLVIIIKLYGKIAGSINEGFVNKDTYSDFDKFFVDVYDKVFDFPALFEHDIELIKDNIKNKKVLDAGSGVGRHYKYLKSHCKKIVGIDKSQGMINKAIVRNDGLLEVKHADLMDENLFKDNEFDVITCLQETMYHNNDDKMKRILNNFYKWLIKDSGTLVIHIFDTTKMDPAPRDYSQFYTDDKGIRHAITYFNQYIHDAWWDNGVYNQRIILEDGSNKTVKLGLNMIEKEKMINMIQDSGFKLVKVIDYSDMDIDQYSMYIFKK